MHTCSSCVHDDIMLKKHSIIIDPAGPRDQCIGPTWPRRSDEASKKQDETTTATTATTATICLNVAGPSSLPFSSKRSSHTYSSGVYHIRIYISIDRQNGSQR